MRKRVCPKCKIPNFYLLNDLGEIRLVFVTSDFEIIPSRPGESTEGFDLTTIYCLGCSWNGSPRKTVKY